MRSVRQCIIQWVTLVALTGILPAAEQSADQLRQEGRELQIKAQRFWAEGKVGDAEEVARKAEEIFRRADEVARQRGPQELRQPQPGVTAVTEFIGRQMEALERYIADLRGRGMGDRAEQLHARCGPTPPEPGAHGTRTPRRPAGDSRSWPGSDAARLRTDAFRRPRDAFW